MVLELFMENITLDRNSVGELANLVEEIQLWLESFELSSNPEFMESMKRSEEQIKNRDFADWNELQNCSN